MYFIIFLKLTFSRIYNSYSEILLVFSSSLLWTVTYSFAVRVRPSENQTEAEGTTTPAENVHCWPEIKNNYLALKNLSKLINDIIGIRLIGSLLKAILYYPILLDGMSKLIHLVQVAGFVYTSTVFFIISANVAFQVRSRITD